MTPDERASSIQSVAEYLAPMSRNSVNTLLITFGSIRGVASEWDHHPVEVRRLLLSHLLNKESNELIDSIKKYLPQNNTDAATKRLEPTPMSANVDRKGPIFVVHGHARTVLHEVVRALEHGTNRDVIILHEKANAGKTILEKFEEHAATAAYAVVLLTGDDEGRPLSTSEAPRARGRQNVIFELGFFFGKLGRERVAVLLDPGVEKPSDVDGLVYISIDEAGAWKLALARELESVDIQVTYSRIP